MEVKLLCYRDICVWITFRNLAAMLEPSVSQSQEKCGHRGLNRNPIHVCEMDFHYCNVQELERREQNDIGLKI